MSGKLLIIAWEFPPVNSSQGMALSRRIGQTANDFIKNSWEVTVIHKDQINEVPKEKQYVLIKENNLLRRISVPGPGLNDYKSWEKLSFIRQLSTILIGLFKGDRSYRWACRVKKIIPEIIPSSSYKPDLIISFFTPRAPLVAGRFASKYYNSTWAVDLQDSIDEGYKPVLIPLVSFWTRRILRTAKVITHVSPEWANRDGKLIDRKIISMRHALPLLKIENEQVIQIRKEKISVLYAGSLDINNQSIKLFSKVYHQLKEEGYSLQLKLAGNEYLKKIFYEELKDDHSINYLGWLDAEKLAQEINRTDLLLVIPWSTSPRQVIPSKFFEFIAYEKPVWIVGNDTGGFEILMKETEHPDLQVTDEKFNRIAIKKAFNGSFENFFELKKCKKHLLRENELFEKFMKLIR